jgi:hypothetical protein
LNVKEAETSDSKAAAMEESERCEGSSMGIARGWSDRWCGAVFMVGRLVG